MTGLLGNYASLMADVSTQLMTGDLSSYQQQALSIERTYRQQVKSANDYAKALGCPAHVPRTWPRSKRCAR